MKSIVELSTQRINCLLSASVVYLLAIVPPQGCDIYSLYMCVYVCVYVYMFVCVW